MAVQRVPWPSNMCYALKSVAEDTPETFCRRQNESVTRMMNCFEVHGWDFVWRSLQYDWAEALLVSLSKIWVDWRHGSCITKICEVYGVLQNSMMDGRDMQEDFMLFDGNKVCSTFLRIWVFTGLPMRNGVSLGSYIMSLGYNDGIYLLTGEGCVRGQLFCFCSLSKLLTCHCKICRR